MLNTAFLRKPLACIALAAILAAGPLWGSQPKRPKTAATEPAASAVGSRPQPSPRAKAETHVTGSKNSTETAANKPNHRKRNWIIAAVVAAGVMTTVIISRHGNGAYNCPVSPSNACPPLPY